VRLALALALLPSPAAAHLVGVEMGPFYAGLLHLLAGPAAGAALLAAALLAALHPRKTAWGTLLAMPAGVLLGGALGLAAAPPGALPLLVAAAALGGLAALAPRLPGPALAALALLAGAGLGLASAEGLPEGAGGGLYALGGAAAGGAAYCVAAAGLTALADGRPLAPLCYRVLGSWIAAFGAMGLALGLAPV
jgi:hypothetical protein